MSLFVLGRSRTGKTPFAAQVALALGVPHLSASEWVRRRFPPGSYPDRQSFVDAITTFSIAELRRNPRVCVEFLRANHDLSRFCIIEGVRNPHDFVHLFDPHRDHVVQLDHQANDLRPTDFESGLALIAGYLDYLETTGLMDRGRRWLYQFRELHEPGGVVHEGGTVEAGATRTVTSLDAAIHDFLQLCRTLPFADKDASPGTTSTGPHRVHADISPLQCHIRGEYLFDMDINHRGEHVPCTAFAVSSYSGSVPTFKILLADGTVFSYVPPSALLDVAKTPDSAPLELKELVYHNCPAGDVAVHRFAGLDGPLHVFIKQRDQWFDGRYLLTLDWYEGNDLLHLIALENGQFAFLPNHKVKFKDGTREFAPYRKMHAEWKV